MQQWSFSLTENNQLKGFSSFGCIGAFSGRLGAVAQNWHELLQADWGKEGRLAVTNNRACRSKLVTTVFRETTAIPFSPNLESTKMLTRPPIPCRIEPNNTHTHSLSISSSNKKNFDLHERGKGVPSNLYWLEPLGAAGMDFARVRFRAVATPLFPQLFDRVWPTWLLE